MSEVQRRLLSALLTHPPSTAKVAALVRPEEFTHPAYRAVYEAMVETVHGGREFDDATLYGRLRDRGMDHDRAQTTVMGCLAAHSSAHAWEEYAAEVRAEALWERTGRAGLMLTDAARERDDLLRLEAQAMLTERAGGGWEDSTESLQDEVWARLEGRRGVGMALPFRGLTQALGGGMMPGEVTVVGGWTSHAKSVLVTQVADNLVSDGADGLYLTNEMRRDEVALRVLAGHGGPPFPSLRAGQMTERQTAKLLGPLQRLALKIINAATRTCEEICAYIQSRKPDIAVVDLFNRLPRTGGGTPELDEQVNRICDAAAKSNAHILLVSQLNRSRLTAAKEYPHPNLGDLRDTGSLATHPANVLFTYLVEKDGIREGFIEVAKARNGEVGVSVDVTLNPGTMRLVQTL